MNSEKDVRGARWRQVAAALLASMVVAACGGAGGGDGDGATAPPPAVPGSATIGAAGGTVSGPEGVRITVPAGAMAGDATIRVAADATGAPTPPADLSPAGAIYAITPHGQSFTQAVEVRIPMPTAALQPDQEIRLAKAEPGGAWKLLPDVQAVDGMLVAQVHDFSYFMTVIVTYPVYVAQAEPLKVTSATVDCGGQDCNALLGPTTVTYRVTMNNGQLPSYCVAGSARATLDVSDDWWKIPSADPMAVPLTGGVLVRTVSESGFDRKVFNTQVTCRRSDGLVLGIAGSDSAVYWVTRPSYPDLYVARVPATLDIVDGGRATLDVLLAGGASKPPGVPTATDRAVVEWQRSDDEGRSWRVVAVSYQDEADPRPFGDVNSPWRHWAVRHGFVAAAADGGALLRVRACYTPPDVAAPPCVIGAATRLVYRPDAAVPTIQDAPRPVLVRTGQTASFTVTASGTPEPTLQWQERDANSTGAWADVATGAGGRTATFTTPVLALVDNGRQYRVVATNAVGQAQSAAATVSVSDLDVAPTITTQPATLAVPAGGDAVFAIAARGTEALSYQWRFNGTPITGANAPVLKLAAVTGANAGRYSVLVTNTAGNATSGEATLDVTAGAAGAVAPSIVTAPAAVSVHAGDTATFAVGVGGTAPFSYQWLKEGQPIEGATLAYYSLAAATSGSAGQYSVRVTNAAGPVTSAAATLTVVAAAAPSAVAITTQPSAQVQMPGGSATFAVAASGTGPLSYQWLKGGAPIAGATGAVLVLNNVTGSDAANYSVTVTNALGSLASEAASLSVVGAPAITTQPAAVSIVSGATATFGVVASGSGLRYQWTEDGVAIAGATAASYTTPVLTTVDTGTVYGVVVYNGAGALISNGAVVTVTNPPPVSPAVAARKLAAAPLHTCAITASNAVACWGDNGSGQIGRGDYGAQPTPYVWSLAEPALQVAAGANGSCAVTSTTGSVWCSGSPVNATVPTQVPGITGARWVTLGATHTCVLAANGSVWCWGNNSGFQLGNGSSTSSGTPVQVTADDGSALTGVNAIDAGDWHTCALMGDGSVRCWGLNSMAQSGSTTDVTPSRATPVSGFSYVDQLALGATFSCGYSSETSQVRCWGLATDGSGTTSPTPATRFDAAPVSVGAGSAMACAIDDAGAVWCWGTGTMGNGNVNETQATPTRVSGLTSGIVMAGGQGHSCVLRNNGTLVCWGSNGSYQLGTGDAAARTTPTAITVAGGFWHP